jgi:hypothetical protein
VLHSRRAGIARVLGKSPAVRLRQPRQQPRDKRPRRRRGSTLAKRLPTGSISSSSEASHRPGSTLWPAANNWQNVFNPGTGFLQPKQLNGQFQAGFNPTTQNGFAEADSYIYTGELPFDLQGIIDAEGGGANWLNYLNGLTSSVTAMGPAQIQMSDEPSYLIPWEYDYVGAPYQAQQVVREIQTQLWSDTPGGLPGNDDLGATSSWYVWSALGFYPETPGTAAVAIGSPLFPAIVIHDGSKTITETAPQAADNAPYVQNLTINGSPWARAYLPASLLRKGGSLDWTLAATPDTSWAAAVSDDAPPSDTAGLLPAFGYATGNDPAASATGGPCRRCGYRRHSHPGAAPGSSLIRLRHGLLGHGRRGGAAGGVVDRPGLAVLVGLAVEAAAGAVVALVLPAQGAAGARDCRAPLAVGQHQQPRERG